MTTLKTTPLITERFLLDKIKAGKRSIAVPEGSIITPLARMMIDEGKITVSD
jgi:ethanolamine utilization cobalamin adenosyltransferase